MIHQEIFENIDAVIDFLRNQGWTLSKSYQENAPFEVIDCGNNRLVYYPQPFGSPLFRGQNEFHEPCISSFYRNKPDNLTQFIQKLKIEEFRIVTSMHPVIKSDIESGIFYNYIALAQHYEFKTEMLDLTNSLPVAAFFAVTRQVSGKYIPIEKSNKEGVIYFINPVTQLHQDFTEHHPEIHPVGWQVFKRPGEQRAFGINLTNKKDFNSISGIIGFRFWHDKNIAEKIYNVFNAGEKLFPRDIFAEKAAEIKDSNKFSKHAFDRVYDNSNEKSTKKEILIELEKRNITIQTKSIWKYSSEDIASIRELSISGKLTENLHATSRLSYLPDNKKSK